MPKKSLPKNGCYLYAIIEGQGHNTYKGIGLNGSDVYFVTDGHHSAMVSDVSNRKIRPERRYLAAHQNVLRRLMEKGETPLPISFGIIAEGPRAIQRILSLNRDAFCEQFKHLHGKVEMGLHVVWDVPNIFDYFVSIHPELRAERDKYFKNCREPTYEDKITLGRLFDRILSEDRENHTQTVEDILSTYCEEIERNKCRTENEVMNLACLVSQDNKAHFEKGVLEAANLFDNNFAFDYNGPWAPHSFVNINLKY
jgi:hypothetical protein